MLSLRLYMLQRLSAMVLAPLILGHIALMIYAIQGGLSSAEILSRTQGSFAWFAYYGAFVIAVSLHAAIGLRVVLHEITGMKGMPLTLTTWGIGLALLALGAKAVWSVTVVL